MNNMKQITHKAYQKHSRGLALALRIQLIYIIENKTLDEFDLELDSKVGDIISSLVNLRKPL